MNNFLKEMNKTAVEAKNSIDHCLHALTFIDSDFKYFLINFFRTDVSKNLLLTKIFYDSPESMFKFQEILFEKSSDFFSKLLNIDGLEFYYDANVPLSYIDLILADTKIASINIFHKELILYEGMFFEEIDNGINKKSKEIDSLMFELNKLTQGFNNNSIFSYNDNKSLSQNMLDNTLFKKRARKDKIRDFEILRYQIIEAEKDLHELTLTREILMKNLLNIQYFQDKIQSRIITHLNYKINKI